MKDFFISYTGKDKNWAVWIAWQLENSGYSTIIQEWDFQAGSNFIVEMHRALLETERTIVVMSEDYLQSAFGTPEWAATFVQDPMGIQRKLIQVKVGECDPQGLLKPLVWINLVGLHEAEARDKLLTGIKQDRAKPQHPPAFPGERSVATKPTFPAKIENVYIPPIKRAKTDLDSSNFIDESFKAIQQYFNTASSAIMRHHPDVVVKLNQVTATKFICEAFLDGQSKAKCMIWVYHPSYSTPQIGYNDSSFSIDNDSSFNEILSISDDPHGFGLQTLMRFGWENQMEQMDFTNLSPQQAAEYLWRRFVSGLGR